MWRLTFPDKRTSQRWNFLIRDIRLGVSSPWSFQFYNSFYDIGTIDQLTSNCLQENDILCLNHKSFVFVPIFSWSNIHFSVNQSCRGLSVNSVLQILLLVYADDLVLFSDTPMELNRKLEAIRLHIVYYKKSIGFKRKEN